MKHYSVRHYKTTDFELWNTFLSDSKNGTFLFHRHFMEYHSDRFQDFSLLVFSNEKLVALLPANVIGQTLYSHQGLTYGGLIYNEKVKLETVNSIFYAILQFLEAQNIKTIYIKSIPSIYHHKPAEELSYILFLAKAKLYRREVLSVINLQRPFQFSKDRKEGIKRGVKNNLEVKETDNFDAFWNEILIPNLHIKHQTKPVHSLEEIKKLHQNFPQNIRQFNVYHNNKIVAGTTIFESNLVAHSQYISGNETKNELGSLDFLHHYLLTSVFKDKSYFDFGISTENEGKNLNQGLSYWKESFGANAIIQDFYEVETANYTYLQNVLL